MMTIIRSIDSGFDTLDPSFRKNLLECSHVKNLLAAARIILTKVHKRILRKNLSNCYSRALKNYKTTVIVIITIYCCCYNFLAINKMENDRGRKRWFVFQRLPPPNRTCGFPASGSPVRGSPFDGLTVEGSQHTFRPDARFYPRPSIADVSLMFSPTGHYVGLKFRIPVLHVSSFLPPFAPRELPRFSTTTTALTPARLSPTAQVSLLNVPGLQTIPPPTTPCRLVIALAHYPSA